MGSCNKIQRISKNGIGQINRPNKTDWVELPIVTWAQPENALRRIKNLEILRSEYFFKESLVKMISYIEGTVAENSENLKT